MNKVNQSTIASLLETEDNATLSIYMPTHRLPSSEHIQEDKIRFKNLIRAGREALLEHGVDEAVVGQMADELELSIYENNDFWQQTTEGLAVFCSPAGSRYFHLPIECDEKATAGDHYDILPLLAVVSYDQPYYLLALATREPVLYRGDMYGVEPTGLKLPESPESALGIDELHSNSQTARAGGHNAGNPGSKSHGQGDSRQAGQEERLKYFRLIEDKIEADSTVDINQPFLLAGTDDEISGYREISKLHHILDADLAGNYTETAVHEIHARAWPLVTSELCDQQRSGLLEKVSNFLGTGKASTESSDIASAAEQGRVDTLMIGMLASTRDSVADSDQPVMKLIFSDRYFREGINSYSRMVFNQGGKVVATLQDIMPNSTNVVALYRF